MQAAQVGDARKIARTFPESALNADRSGSMLERVSCERDEPSPDGVHDVAKTMATASAAPRGNRSIITLGTKIQEGRRTRSSTPAIQHAAPNQSDAFAIRGSH
jgi:hypothetical protein